MTKDLGGHIPGRGSPTGRHEELGGWDGWLRLKEHGDAEGNPRKVHWIGMGGGGQKQGSSLIWASGQENEADERRERLKSFSEA